ncbi:MAG TPA: T9SS type A sorting domain-containing protein, partial [Hymenobacter sp.]|uniref:T9SS type A sorting domain-containing protein n=1 Tax=Hymenobacter sp. TaxID=1898978 RepID=UPI002ED8C2CF
GVRTGFRQQVIDLNQTKYLHGDFQFRFVASGNASDNSDNWSVDYVLLNSGRTAALADTTFVDVAAGAGLLGSNPSGGLRSPLRRFSAMPVWQFNAANPANSELNPSLGVNFTNLAVGAPLSVNVLGTVRELPAGPVLGSWLQASRLLTAGNRQQPVVDAAGNQALSLTANPKTLRYSMALTSSETNPLTLANDTISRDMELGTYYAYDDGTAENVTNLLPYSTGQQSAFAYRFDLNQADYVRGLRLYPVFTASDAASRSVTISVWDVDPNGAPIPTPRATKVVTIPFPLPAGWQYFEVTFDQPVPVRGSFFVGYSQPSTGRTLHYGLDLNSTFPARHLWLRNDVGVWDTTNFVPRGSQPRGALMMRPVMTNNVTTATASAREAAAYSLYPNPARGTVKVAGPAFARASVLDALGRTVWEQPAAQAGQATLPLPALPAGIYTVRLVLADGRTVGRRLMIE